MTDVSRPVENPALERGLAAFWRTRSPESQVELTARLRAATFLVPMLTDEMTTSPTGVPGRLTIKQGSRIKLLDCTDEAGASHLPLFTQLRHVQGRTGERVSTLVLPAAEAWGFVLSQPQYAGAVVNPGTETAMPLARPILEYLAGRR